VIRFAFMTTVGEWVSLEAIEEHFMRDLSRKSLPVPDIAEGEGRKKRCDNRHWGLLIPKSNQQCILSDKNRWEFRSALYTWCLIHMGWDGIAPLEIEMRL
jgi:hypothetical protein